MLACFKCLHFHEYIYAWFGYFHDDFYDMHVMKCLWKNMYQVLKWWIASMFYEVNECMDYEFQGRPWFVFILMYESEVSFHETTSMIIWPPWWAIHLPKRNGDVLPKRNGARWKFMNHKGPRTSLHECVLKIQMFLWETDSKYIFPWMLSKHVLRILSRERNFMHDDF